VSSGLVLDVPAGNAANGTLPVQWAANGGNNQKWKLTYNANGTYTISPKLNEAFCLDLPAGSTANGTKPVLWAKGTNKANQQFLIK
jgi:hypothetical protein